MNPLMLCAYKPGDCAVTTVFNEQGISIYSEMTIDEARALGCEIMTLEKAIDCIEQADAARFAGPWVEATQEDYWEALECLPPENFVGGCFRMMEYTTGLYTTHWIKRGDRFFCATRKAVAFWAGYLAELELQLADSK